MSNPYAKTPDGRRYIAMSAGARVERPYSLRWLAPFVCRTDIAWIILSHTSVAACAILAIFYAHSWAAAFLVLGLSGVTLFNLRHPILVDAPAMALALGAALAWRAGWWPVALGLSIAAGATKETGPVFASAWAWSPVLLIGMIAPALRWFVKPGADVIQDEASEARKDLRRRIVAQRRKYSDPSHLILPWGVCVLGLAHPSAQLVVVLLLAYGQLLVATDTVRLFAWAFPVMIAATIHNVSSEWLIPLVAIHVANPFRGPGL